MLELEEDKHLLLFTMHHIVSDGWSMEILVREVGALYQAYSAGDQSPLAELPIQYADFAVWQRQYLAGGVMESEVGYWKKQLKDAPVLGLPTDYARPSAPSHQGGIERVEIGNLSSEGLRRLSQREGVTLFMVLMAAFKVVLMRWSGEEDISVGTSIANRTRREVEGLIGFFINTLVMADQSRRKSEFQRVSQERERGGARRAYGRQEVPFEKLVEEVNPDRDLSRSPLFQVMMELQNTGQENLEIRGLKVRGVGEGKIEEEIGTTKFDLTLTLVEGGEGIAGILEYSRDLYQRETIRRMARHFEKVVEGVVKDADQRIRQIELLSVSEREQILLKWNDTAVEYPKNQSIHELFEQQVERTPEVVAVVFQDQGLTYRELNARANRLARALGRTGSRAGSAGSCAGRARGRFFDHNAGGLQSGRSLHPARSASPISANRSGARTERGRNRGDNFSLLEHWPPRR